MFCQRPAERPEDPGGQVQPGWHRRGQSECPSFPSDLFTPSKISSVGLFPPPPSASRSGQPRPQMWTSLWTVRKYCTSRAQSGNQKPHVLIEAIHFKVSGPVRCRINLLFL